MVGSFRRIIVALIPGCLAIGDVSFFFFIDFGCEFSRYIMECTSMICINALNTRDRHMPVCLLRGVDILLEHKCAVVSKFKDSVGRD
jgi:hypothetical protein